MCLRPGVPTSVALTVCPHPLHVNLIPLCTMFAGAVAFGGACPDPVGRPRVLTFPPLFCPRERRRIERELARITFGASRGYERCRRFGEQTFHLLSASTSFHDSVQENKHPSWRLRSRARDSARFARLMWISHLVTGRPVFWRKATCQNIGLGSMNSTPT